MWILAGKPPMWTHNILSWTWKCIFEEENTRGVLEEVLEKGMEGILELATKVKRGFWDFLEEWSKKKKKGAEKRKYSAEKPRVMWYHNGY